MINNNSDKRVCEVFRNYTRDYALFQKAWRHTEARPDASFPEMWIPSKLSRNLIIFFHSLYLFQSPAISVRCQTNVSFLWGESATQIYYILACVFKQLVTTKNKMCIWKPLKLATNDNLTDFNQVKVGKHLQGTLLRDDVWYHTATEKYISTAKKKKTVSSLWRKQHRVIQACQLQKPNWKKIVLG